MLNVLAYRPEFVSPWSMHSHMTPITLNRLERPEVEALIGHQAGNKTVPSEVIEHIVAKADGVPLYVEELTKSILESDYLHEEAGRYTLAGPLSEVAIPATLQDSLMARLDRLLTAREIAQWGAVLGREFTYEMLHSLAPLEEPVLQTGLGQLVNNELLYQRGRPPRSRYIFKHALIQDAAYQSLLKRTRQQYHQQVAALMEEQFPETTVTEPEVLAHHYTAAELHEQAANYWLKAGKAAVQRSAMLEASAQLIKGLEVIKSLPDGQARDRMELALQANLGPALRAAKGPATPEAGQAFARGYELSQQFGVTQNQCPVLFGLFYFHWARGHFREARRNAEELMKLAKTIGTDEQLLVSHSALGVLLWNVGENTSALPHLKKALAIYDPESHASLVSAYATEFGVFAQRYFGYVSFALGYPDRLLQSARDAVALARALKNPISLCYALAGASVALKLRREPEATLQLADELSAVAIEQGFPTWSLYAAMARGWALAQLEQVQEGAAEFEKGWAGWQTAGTNVWRPWLGALLTEVYIKGGRTREALRLSEEELRRTAKGGENQFESLLLLTRGDARLAQDDPDELEAERYYREAIDVACRQSAKSWELRAATRLGCLWRDQGKRQEARDLLAPIISWFTEGFDTADLKEAKALTAELS
jgi:predicted ATPase